jgi:hypothetical protein
MPTRITHLRRSRIALWVSCEPPAAQVGPIHEVSNAGRVIRTLECYLQVTRQRLGDRSLEDGTLGALAMPIIGALRSKRLIDGHEQWKYLMTRSFLLIFKELKRINKPLEMPSFRNAVSVTDPTIMHWARHFDCEALDAEKLWLWNGWFSVNRTGEWTAFPLYFFYKRLGKAFTQSLFEVLDQYFAARKMSSVMCLRSLGKYVEQYPELLSPSDFKDAAFMTKFWREFFRFFVTTSYADGNGSQIATIKGQWRAHVFLIKHHLIPSGLFAQPFGDLPCPDIREPRGSRTNIRTTKQGHEIKTKLLTHVPLNVTDAEAIDILFRRIEGDLNEIGRCANWSSADLWQRYLRRLHSAPLGIPRVFPHDEITGSRTDWAIDRSNPDHLLNASATLAARGYESAKDRRLQQLYPQPLTETARELGLPTTDSLLPHCILLVIEHPTITSSFLDKFELYDKNGKMAGFRELDGNVELIGYKARRGSRYAQQIIALSEKSASIVRQIICLTADARNYLRDRGDDQWRYLLLTTRRAFGTPIRYRSHGFCKKDIGRPDRIVAELGEISTLSEDERTDLVGRLSLHAVRASAGVLVYLKTKSVGEMAKALGHAQYNSRLLERYLPGPILDFFQERWIRIFQTGILVEAMKESPNLLEATDFASMDHLHQYLSNHALKILPQPVIRSSEQSEPVVSAAKKSEVVFGVNETILMALHSLKISVDAATAVVDARATYWVSIYRELASYIRSNLRERADLHAYLQSAIERATPLTIGGLIHGK